MALFFAKHVVILAALLVTAAGAGTLIVGPRGGIAVRSALGLALCAHTLFFLGVLGHLTAVPIVALTLVAIIGGGIRARRLWTNSGLHPALVAGSAAAVAPLFVLALQPPLAFDETLYHLPLVRALAAAGELRFRTDLRFPVFPQLHELLCVPLLLFAGDVATHLVSVAEVVIAAALLIEWGRRHHTNAGPLAAAVFLGSPIVIHLATIGYVDAGLMLFVTAGFYCLDRGLPESDSWLALSGFFFGTACSVKYLGGFFAVAAVVIVIAGSAHRRRATAAFAISCFAAAIPTSAWLIEETGNPLFPFLPRLFGPSAWTISMPAAISTFERVVRGVRVPWDVTFARERMNFQPPLTPLLIVVVILALAAAVRNARVRLVVLVSAGYLTLFSFLPQDSRYLLPLVPVVSVAAAVIISLRWPKATAICALIAIAPGVAYAAYRLTLQGVPPVTPQQRIAVLERRIPEYRALMRAGRERVYVCGAEQLKDYAGGELLGDFNGPYSYERVLGDEDKLAQTFRRIGVRYFLVSRRVCAPPRSTAGLALVYEDQAAQLWRVQPFDAR